MTTSVKFAIYTDLEEQKFRLNSQDYLNPLSNCSIESFSPKNMVIFLLYYQRKTLSNKTGCFSDSVLKQNDTKIGGTYGQIPLSEKFNSIILKTTI